MIRRQVQQRKRLVCELKAVERELKAVEVGDDDGYSKHKAQSC